VRRRVLGLHRQHDRILCGELGRGRRADAGIARRASPSGFWKRSPSRFSASRWRRARSAPHHTRPGAGARRSSPRLLRRIDYESHVFGPPRRGPRQPRSLEGPSTGLLHVLAYFGRTRRRPSALGWGEGFAEQCGIAWNAAVCSCLYEHDSGTREAPRRPAPRQRQGTLGATPPPAALPRAGHELPDLSAVCRSQEILRSEVAYRRSHAGAQARRRQPGYRARSVRPSGVVPRAGSTLPTIDAGI